MRRICAQNALHQALDSNELPCHGVFVRDFRGALRNSSRLIEENTLFSRWLKPPTSGLLMVSQYIYIYIYLYKEPGISNHDQPLLTTINHY